jgi:hypothetical protein
MHGQQNIKRDFISINVQRHSVLGTTQQHVALKSLIFLSVGKFKSLAYSTTIENEETPHQPILYIF